MIWLTVLMCGSVFSGELMAIEEAKYDVVRSDAPFEVRDYATSVVAEVVVKGEFKEVGNRAFRKLFRYISGDNKTQVKISMTAPVSQESTSEKIAMTAPVAQQETDGGWAVSFMMPASYTMKTVPEPLDTNVKMREVSGYRAAVIRYSGSWKLKKYNTKLALLLEWIRENGLETTGKPVFARYNAPITPWFLRRNEIVIPVAK